MSGGAPWTVSSGEASVSSSGSLKVEVQGLLLTPGAPANLVGTVGPVQMVAASLVCGGSGGMVVDSTPGVPLSRQETPKSGIPSSFPQHAWRPSS